MLRLALEGALLVPAAGAAAISGEALGELARKYLLAEAVIDRLARIIDRTRCVRSSTAASSISAPSRGRRWRQRASSSRAMVRYLSAAQRVDNDAGRDGARPSTTRSTRSGCWWSSASTTATSRPA